MRTRLLAIGLAAVLAAGCVAEDPTVMIVLGNQRIDPKAQCVAKGGGGTQEMLPVGYMDLLLTDRFVMVPVVRNQMTATETATGAQPVNMQLNANVINITGAWVSYDVDGLVGPYNIDENKDGVPDESTSLPDEVYAAGNTFVDPAGTNPVILEIVPPTVGRLLDKDAAFNDIYSGGYLKATVVLQGFLADGTEVHSPPYVYPIVVCRGCMVSYVKVAPPYCCRPAVEPEEVPPCFPGQEPADCLSLCPLFYYGRDRVDRMMAMMLGYINSLKDAIPGWAQPCIDYALGYTALPDQYPCYPPSP